MPEVYTNDHIALWLKCRQFLKRMQVQYVALQNYLTKSKASRNVIKKLQYIFKMRQSTGVCVNDNSKREGGCFWAMYKSRTFRDLVVTPK